MLSVDMTCISTCTPGTLRWKASSASEICREVASAEYPTMICPRAPAAFWREARMVRSNWATVWRASSRKTAPSGVGRTRGPLRSKIRNPKSISVSFTAFEMAGCAILSVSAAARNPLASATAKAYRRCRRSSRVGFLVSVMRMFPGDRVSLSLDQSSLFVNRPLSGEVEAE